MIAEQKQMVNIPTLPRPTTRPVPEREGGFALPEREPMHPRRPMAHRGPLPVRKVKAFHENSRTPGAVLVAAFSVSLLCLYVSAYARVTAEGFELSRLRAQVHEATIQNSTLQSEVSRLTLPDTVKLRAQALGMEENNAQSVILVGGAANTTAPTQNPNAPIPTNP